MSSLTTIMTLPRRRASVLLSLVLQCGDSGSERLCDRLCEVVEDHTEVLSLDLRLSGLRGLSDDVGCWFSRRGCCGTMKNELPSGDDIVKWVEVVGTMVGELELKSRRYASPQCIGQATAKRATLLSLRKTILTDEEARDGVELAIIGTKFFEGLYAEPLLRSGKAIEVVDGVSAILAAGGVEFEDSLLELVEGGRDIGVLWYRGPDVFFVDRNIGTSIALLLSCVGDTTLSEQGS